MQAPFIFDCNSRVFLLVADYTQNVPIRFGIFVNTIFPFKDPLFSDRSDLIFILVLIEAFLLFFFFETPVCKTT